ncbi:hypothetical protein A2U01_0013595 [Trifolium medium]|uniref:Uncharacterized protein n=1 Tax=Trifolium medium TaxID=97028 RepID=A0A392N0D5_9FABA|nr:hypothetical protein [Trifolium medium]
MCHILKEQSKDEVVHFLLTEMEEIYNLQELEFNRLGKVLANSENELKVLKEKEAKLKKGYEDAILALKKSMEDAIQAFIMDLQNPSRNN